MKKDRLIIAYYYSYNFACDIIQNMDNIIRR